MKQLLGTPRRIALVGASNNPARAAYDVFAYLQRAGHDVLPVTPKPEPVHGITPVPDLAAAAEHWQEGIEIVDIFRNKLAARGVVREAIDAGARLAWFQFHTDNPDAVAAAQDAGMDVVVDRCIKIEHARYA